MEKFKYLNLEYPSGCILAKATITDCVYIDDKMRKILAEKDSLIYSSIIKHAEWKGYGFQLENVEKIESIPANGKLSLWDYDYLPK